MAVHTLNIPRGTKKVYDVGELQVQLCATLAVGQTAPPFDAKCLDGGTVSLNETKGKVTVLVFWATWCGDSSKMVAELNSIQDEFGKNARFAMLGLSLDRSPEPLKRFVQEHDIAWPQACLGDWSETAMPAQYAVTFIPAVVVIGHDGNVLARTYGVPNTREAIQKGIAALPKE
jgi:peroxiredoxin